MPSLPKYNHSPLDLMRSRTSVRRYSGELLTGEARQQMELCCKAATAGPFGNTCRFQLIDNHIGSEVPGQRIGAYGIISGARTYLAGATESKGHGPEDFGYLFELLVLKATDLGLGSCWLGGTFTRGRFSRAMGLREEEVILAVSPIGRATRQRSVVDRVIRWGAGSKKRKPWAELFWDGETAAPLSQERAGQFATALEMVRLAPSASNRQPWRCLKVGDTIHFFLLRSPGYGAVTPTDLQRIDMGIAMAHFELAVETSGTAGEWRILDPPVLADPSTQLPETWQKSEYLVSWQP